MRTHARFPVAAALVMVCGMALPMMGQQGSPVPSKVQPVQGVHPGNPVLMGGAVPSAQQAETPYELKVSLEFKGGTLDEYVRALRAAAGESPVNVLYSREVGDIEVPPVALKDASIYGALHSLTRIASAPEEAALVVNVEAGVISISLFQQGGNRLSHQRREMERQDLRVMSIRDLLESTDPQAKDGTTLPADTVLTAVTQALELMPTSDQQAPTVKYHKESGLLLVVGRSDQNNIVSQTLAAMRSDLQARKEQSNRVREAESIRERDKQIEEQRVMKAQAELAVATRKVFAAEEVLAKELEKQKKGLATMDEIRWEQAKLDGARLGMKQAEEKLARSQNVEGVDRRVPAESKEVQRGSALMDQSELVELMKRIEFSLSQSNELLQKISENTGRK